VVNFIPVYSTKSRLLFDVMLTFKYFVHQKVRLGYLGFYFSVNLTFTTVMLLPIFRIMHKIRIQLLLIHII